MVRPKSRPRDSSERSRKAAGAPLRDHSSVAGDQSADSGQSPRHCRWQEHRHGGLIVAERRYPHRVGQTYRLKYSPKHRWFYFPEMRRDEALVFKVYDSEKDGRARFTPHTSFQDPTSPPNAPARQSIEVRALAFFAP